MKKKILISTGGSGGHVIPATIFHDHLLKKKDVIISTDNRVYKYLNKDIHKISISKPFIGPAIIMKEDKLMTMITLLPDINQNSDDYLLMALFIFKL